MAYTQLQVVNMALDWLGNLPITSIDSTTDATAIKAKRIWPFALEEFLASAAWSWAKKRDRFDIKATTKSTTNGAFTMPAVGATVNVTCVGDVSGFATPGTELVIDGYNRMTSTAIVSQYVVTVSNDSADNAEEDTVIASGSVVAWEDAAPVNGWLHSYVVPTDCVTLLGINETYADTPSDIYEIEGLYLLTDEEAVIGEYVRRWGGVPSTETLDTFLAPMDAFGANALAVLLACKLAPQIAQDGISKAAQLLQLYDREALPKARVRNGNQIRRAPSFPYHTSTALMRRRDFTNH